MRRMSSPGSYSFMEMWAGRERWARTGAAFVPYALLAFSAFLAVLIDRADGHSPLGALVISALTAAWLLWMYTLHPAWRTRKRPMHVFLTGLLALMTVLVIAYPWFGFFSFTGYFYVYSLLSSWRARMACAALLAVLTGVSEAGGLPSDNTVRLAIFLGAILVNLFIVCALTWFNRISHMEQAERERAVAELGEANRRLEATLAENAGLHKQLLAQAREAGALDERQRMAREIHDTLAQGLTGIITQLQAAGQVGQDPVERRRHFDTAIQLARDSLTEARRSVAALRPEQLETARLAEALAVVARRWSELNRIPVHVVTTGTVRPVRPDAESALLRAAQEALANVARHAAAAHVWVTLSYMDDEVVLDVRDDGSGFDLSGGGRDGGFGLVAMRQRIEGVAGTLQVESEPGQGTAISACVPAAAERVPA